MKIRLNLLTKTNVDLSETRWILKFRGFRPRSLYNYLEDKQTFFPLTDVFPNCLLAPIIVTWLSPLRNLATPYRPSALSTQSSGLDFPRERIIIAHQFRTGTFRCDLIVCPRVHNSPQPRRDRDRRSMPRG